MIDTMESRRKKYGPVHGLYRGTKPQLVLGDPDMLKDALVRDWHAFADRRGGGKDGNHVTDNFLTSLSGKEWKRMRTVMTPTFTSGKMKSMFNIINDCCHLMVGNIGRRIRERTSGDGPFELNFRHLAGCYSMDVIAKCCFATETNSFDDPNQVFVTYARSFFRASKVRRFLGLMLPSWIKRTIGFTTQPKDSLLFLEHVARTLLVERMKTGNSAPTDTKRDYLQLMIEASKGQGSKVADEKVPDNESHHGYEEMNGKINETLIKETINELKQPLSTDEIVSNSVLFLAVGYDTTGSLITMAAYLLTTNPEKQTKLYQEVKRAQEQNGGKLDYETISGLKYLDAVISESLRIFPSVPVIERRALEDYTFKNGIFIPRGGIISLPIWNMHHDPKYWKESETFEPERFLPENRDKIIPYTYIPFGGGPRNCIGMRFALLEAKLVIAHLIINFEFVPTANTDVPLDLSPSTGLLTPKRVFLGVQTRNNK